MSEEQLQLLHVISYVQLLPRYGFEVGLAVHFWRTRPLAAKLLLVSASLSLAIFAYQEVSRLTWDQPVRPAEFWAEGSVELLTDARLWWYLMTDSWARSLTWLPGRFCLYAAILLPVARPGSIRVTMATVAR
jgi:hypothetical protein